MAAREHLFILPAIHIRDEMTVNINPSLHLIIYDPLQKYLLTVAVC